MDQFMQLAVDEARAARAAGDYPFGAALVREGKVIALGRNRLNTTNDPTSHAETDALRAAGLQENYEGMVMYASAFPCLMCAGAITWLGVREVIVGASWEGCESSRALMEAGGVKVTVLELEECKELLR